MTAIRLLGLAAIWGGSFLFMRLAAPSLGAVWVAELRVLFAALFLLGAAMVLRRALAWRLHWRHYLMLGAFNSAIPFLLFAYAAQTLSAALLAVLNATAPIWGAIIQAGLGRERLTLATVLGLLLGLGGVVLLVGFDTSADSSGGLTAALAAGSASICYGIASAYAANAPAVEPYNNAHGSMWASVILLSPLLLLVPAPAVSEPQPWLAVLALGVLCSGIAYLLYFGLIADLGATRALSVTFLIPVFGVFWGWLFLEETVGWYTAAGGGAVLAGVALVTGAWKRWAAVVSRRDGD